MSVFCRAVASFVAAIMFLPAFFNVFLFGTENINENIYGQVRPDTWVAVDGLGRTLPTFTEVGETDNEKFVGLFYWLWHYNFASGNEADNMQTDSDVTPGGRFMFAF